MQRKYLKNLIEWKNDPERKPLLVWGARQVGKSYLVEELFAKEYYKEKYLKIDLSDDVQFSEYVERNNLERTLEYIELKYNFHPDKDHLLFFDEVQECPALIKMMKHFCENKREIPVIVSGSLVRISLNRQSKNKDKSFLFPVGKINQLNVYPLTFDEFLMNYNLKKYNYVRSHFLNKEPIDEVLHNEILDDFRNYMYVGGMPEVVNVFLNNMPNTIIAFKKVQEKLQEIYDNYLDDMSLYQTTQDSIIKTRIIYNDIFKQLNKENKNFKISNTIEGAKNRDLINPYFWLNTSGVALKAYCVKEKVTSPLIEDDESLFRLYLSDVGMFSHQSRLQYKDFLLNKENTLSGIYYENFLATELNARKIKLFYWKGKRNSEFEFLIQIGQDIIPIDVKKSKGSFYSIDEYRTHNKNNLVIKVSQNGYGYNEDNKILTLPFYYFSFYLDDITQ